MLHTKICDITTLVPLYFLQLQLQEFCFLKYLLKYTAFFGRPNCHITSQQMRRPHGGEQKSQRGLPQSKVTWASVSRRSVKSERRVTDFFNCTIWTIQRFPWEQQCSRFQFSTSFVHCQFKNSNRETVSCQGCEKGTLVACLPRFVLACWLYLL